MKIYLGKGNSKILTSHKKYIKAFKLYDRGFNHLIVHKLIEEIGSHYKNEKNLAGNTNRNKGLKKIIKHCYTKHNGIIITGTEIKSLLKSFEKDNYLILKCPWLLDIILSCIIELAGTLNKKILSDLIKENSISCVDILTPNHKRILNAFIIKVEESESRKGKKEITDKLKKRLMQLSDNLDKKFDAKCKLI